MKIINGVVKSIPSPRTVIVEVERLVPHKIYGKVQRRKTSFKVDLRDEQVRVGDKIRIAETRPFSKDKNFKIYTAGKKGAKNDSA